jgi:hypothetical protein
VAILKWNNTTDKFESEGFGVGTVAPADADLQAGDLALWYDDTNGAAKLKIKAKSANGTVVAGEVALA